MNRMTRLLQTLSLALSILACAAVLPSCEQEEVFVTVNLYVFGSDGKTAERSTYTDKLVEMIGKKHDWEELRGLTLQVVDSRLSQRMKKIEFNAIQNGERRKKSAATTIDELFKASSTTSGIDEGYLNKAVSSLVGNSSTGSPESALIAIVGRMPTCLNSLGEVDRQLAKVQRGKDSLPPVLWLVPGSRKTDEELLKRLKKRFVVEQTHIDVPNYDECSASTGASASEVAGPESFVISFVKSQEEAQLLAEKLSTIDNSTRYQVYRDGDTSPTTIQITNQVKRSQVLASALFNGTRPQFNSVNYLLKSALYRWGSADVPRLVTKLYIVGDMPTPKAIGGKGILTSKGDLLRLPKSVEVVFVKSRGADSLGSDLRNSYKLLGYNTRVVEL